MDNSKILAEKILEILMRNCRNSPVLGARNEILLLINSKLDSAYKEGCIDTQRRLLATGGGSAGGDKTYAEGKTDALEKVLESLPVENVRTTEDYNRDSRVYAEGWNAYLLAAREIIQGLIKD